MIRRYVKYATLCDEAPVAYPETGVSKAVVGKEMILA